MTLDFACRRPLLSSQQGYKSSSNLVYHMMMENCPRSEHKICVCWLRSVCWLRRMKQPNALFWSSFWDHCSNFTLNTREAQAVLYFLWFSKRNKKKVSWTRKDFNWPPLAVYLFIVYFSPSICLSIPEMDFSRDGCYMALAERRDCKDYVSVFVCDDWHLLRVGYRRTCDSWREVVRAESWVFPDQNVIDCLLQHFEAETQDLAGVEWSPNGCVLAVWDSCLEVSCLYRSWRGLWTRKTAAYLNIRICCFNPFVSHVCCFSIRCCCIR